VLVEAQDYPQLSEIIGKSTDLSLNETLEGIPQGGVDLFTLYEWIFNEILLDTYKTSIPFVNTAPNTFITFAFTFDVGVLGVGYKSEFTPNVLGVSLYGIIPELNFLTLTGRILPITLTAQSYERLFVGDEKNRTYGFTQLIIHENGHSIGLSHPHGNSWAASMVNDPMSYVSYAYEFSQFSKDQVRRGEINHALFFSKVYIDNIEDEEFRNSAIEEYNKKVSEIYSLMGMMRYVDAYEIAWEAFSASENAYKDQPVVTTEDTPAAQGFTWESISTAVLFMGLVLKRKSFKSKKTKF
jgi:hypothetical protein